jgi:hypothetical protein
MFIPKEFINGKRIENGPMTGTLAQPCLCGHPVEDEDEGILVAMAVGNKITVHLLHPEHAPAVLLQGGMDGPEF